MRTSRRPRLPQRRPRRTEKPSLRLLQSRSQTQSPRREILTHQRKVIRRKRRRSSPPK